MATKKKIGQWLCDLGHLQTEELTQALEKQAGERPRPLLGAVLKSLHFVTEEQLLDALAKQMGVEIWDPETAPPDPALKSLIPAALAQACKVIPLSRDNGYLCCVTAAPLAPADRRKIEFLASRPIRLTLAGEEAIAGQLHNLYGLSVESMIAGLVKADTEEGGEQEVQIHDLREMAEEPTLINLVNAIISNAIVERASDIHIEPFEAEIKLKYRIDGILQEMPPPPKQFQSAVISRVKIMAGMDIAERYIPQDGHIRVNNMAAEVDIRVSTVPTVYGESVVLRLLNKDESLLKLTRLGMSETTHVRVSRLLSRPFGIILVCGPTGSGKTTTLYSALLQIYTPAKKIITIEDPVEYQIQGINQIPVRPKRGLTFAAGLRSILRQDPDIIMIGEIRDRETADIAIRAALTGHLVFSTLHTNDAPSAVTRLLDMGLEPFLIASSLQGALGQRLVRQLCPHCRVPREPDPLLARQFEIAAEPYVSYEPGGCEECRGRGYHGRIGIFELLTMNEQLHGLVLRSATSAEIKTAAKATMQTMRQDGWNKIIQGRTTISEVLQATQARDVDDT